MGRAQESHNLHAADALSVRTFGSKNVRVLRGIDTSSQKANLYYVVGVIKQRYEPVVILKRYIQSSQEGKRKVIQQC